MSKEEKRKEFTPDSVVNEIERAGYFIIYDDNDHAYVMKKGIEYSILSWPDREGLVYISRSYRVLEEDLDIVSKAACAINEIIDMGKISVSQMSDNNYYIEVSVSNLYSSLKGLRKLITQHIKAVDDAFDMFTALVKGLNEERGKNNKIA